MFPDPFRKGDNLLVMCETFRWEDNTYTKLVPTLTNFRHFATQIWDENKGEEPWYGIEQEYQMLTGLGKFSTMPLGWPKDGYPAEQGPYYCSAGASNCFGRAIADAHYAACLHAGINISGTNAEVAPGQWEYQVGPCLGVEVGDHLYMARYLLNRVAEDYGIDISIAPKLFPEWNGSGCHTNFSTKTMRSGEGKMKYLEDMMEKFSAQHKKHITLYGEDNHLRLTGHHETSSVETFSYGVGNRAASFRIPTSVRADNGKGYIEDRRPASNIDPYVVASIIFDTGVLNSTKGEPLVAQYNAWKQNVKECNVPMPR